MNYNVTSDRIIVQEVKQEMSEGGIVMPTTVQDNFSHGKVIKVGPGRTTESAGRAPMTITEGMHVMYITKRAVPIKIEGKEYMILNEEDIAVYRELN